MYVCMCVCMYVCMYVCKYVCMYVGGCIFAHGAVGSVHAGVWVTFVDFKRDADLTVASSPVGVADTDIVSYFIL